MTVAPDGVEVGGPGGVGGVGAVECALWTEAEPPQEIRVNVSRRMQTQRLTKRRGCKWPPSDEAAGLEWRHSNPQSWNLDYGKNLN